MSVKEANLFALGPLVGDKFCSILKGGALGVTRCFSCKDRRKKAFVVEREEEWHSVEQVYK